MQIGYELCNTYIHLSYQVYLTHISLFQFTYYGNKITGNKTFTTFDLQTSECLQSELCLLLQNKVWQLFLLCVSSFTKPFNELWGQKICQRRQTCLLGICTTCLCCSVSLVNNDRCTASWQQTQKQNRGVLYNILCFYSALPSGDTHLNCVPHIMKHVNCSMYQPVNCGGQHTLLFTTVHFLGRNSNHTAWKYL